MVGPNRLPPPLELFSLFWEQVPVERLTGLRSPQLLLSYWPECCTWTGNSQVLLVVGSHCSRPNIDPPMLILKCFMRSRKLIDRVPQLGVTWECQRTDAECMPHLIGKRNFFNSAHTSSTASSMCSNHSHQISCRSNNSCLRLEFKCRFGCNLWSDQTGYLPH